MADTMKVIASATVTTAAYGTSDPFSPERQRARDVALAVSLCGCGHQRNLHYSGDVRGRDWRGATGPCQKNRCKCTEFSVRGPSSEESK